jgi:hypothetical protein
MSSQSNGRQAESTGFGVALKIGPDRCGAAIPLGFAPVVDLAAGAA